MYLPVQKEIQKINSDPMEWENIRSAGAAAGYGLNRYIPAAVSGRLLFMRYCTQKNTIFNKNYLK